MDVKLRQIVRTRASQQCEYCGLPQEFSELRFHIEHVTPRQHGGDDASVDTWTHQPVRAVPSGAEQTLVLTYL